MLLRAFNNALSDEESLLKQQAKVHWLKEGDGNTGYFLNMVRGKLNRNRVRIIEDELGSVH